MKKSTLCILLLFGFVTMIFVPETATAQDKIWEKKVFRGKDPFSPPKTKVKCRKTKKVFGAKICVE